MNSPAPYDAVLFVSFGGPEGPDDVMPFLENVLRGRPVPRERMLEVAEHYQHFGGVSPINQQTRDLISAVETDLRANGLQIPIYWGNRNWHPMLTDTMTQMVKDGVKSAIAFVVSGYSSYSAVVSTERIFWPASRPAVSRPRASTRSASSTITRTSSRPTPTACGPPCSRSPLRPGPRFTSRSPLTASPSRWPAGANYQQQLTETCRLVSEAIGVDASRWKLVYQSRSAARRIRGSIRTSVTISRPCMGKA